MEINMLAAFAFFSIWHHSITMTLCFTMMLLVYLLVATSNPNSRPNVRTLSKRVVYHVMNEWMLIEVISVDRRNFKSVTS